MIVISSSKLHFIAVSSLTIMPADKSFAAGHLPFKQATLTLYLSERIKVLFRKRYQNCILKYYFDMLEKQLSISEAIMSTLELRMIQLHYI